MTNLINSFNRRLNNKVLWTAILIVTLFGVADTAYLTFDHYFGEGVKCLITQGCEIVLTSQYSKIVGVPLALIGLLFYAGMFIIVNLIDIYQNKYLLKLLVAGGVVGFASSLVFLYLQLFVLKALCFYCLLSFGSSTTLLMLGVILYMKNSNQNVIQ